VTGLRVLVVGAGVAGHVTIAPQQFRDHRGRLLAGVDTHAFWHGVGDCLAIRRTACWTCCGQRPVASTSCSA